MTEPSLREPSPRVPTVVVVGGGYAGVNVAKALDDAAQVDLVEPRDAFVHNVAALRALVDPSWLPRIFIPYDGLLANGRVVRDRAVEVVPGRVTVASGEEIPADVVVLATGSRYPFPAKADVHDADEAIARFRAAHEELAGADRVLLVGAGPVGLELAGEIVAAWPEKRVTLVDMADDILAGPYAPELRAELRTQLDELGVEVLLGSPLTALPPTDPGVRGAFTVRTQAGREVTADLWYRTHGVTPVTDYLSGSLADARTAGGLVAVTPHLRVAGHDTVFALGDIADADRQMAGIARRQADVVAANVRALLDGAPLTAYERMPAVIVVPLGPEGGAGQLPGADGIAGREAAAEIKGRHMLVDHYAGLLGVPVA